MALLVYMTMAGLDEAQHIAQILLEERLAAGVNILPSMESRYWWKGKLCRAQEAACLAQTEDDRFEALRARVCALHSYETPCIVAMPLARGQQDFLDWIRESTRPVPAS